MLGVLVLASLCLAGPARSVTITFTDSRALSSIEISGVLSVPRFDPALGNLVGVSFSITGSVQALLGIRNDGAGTLLASAFSNIDFDVDSVQLSLGAAPDFSVFSSTGTVGLGVGESVLFPISNSTTITGNEAPSAALLLPGTVDVSFSTATSFGASAGGDATVSHAADAGISFSITYDFIPVPEPTSLAMLALGLLGIARAARLRPV